MNPAHLCSRGLFASVILLAAVGLNSTRTLQAAPGDGTVQPFKCDRNVNAQFIESNDKYSKEFSLDSKGSVVQCLSSGSRSGTCGLNVRTGKVDRFTYIHIWYKGAPDAAKFVTTRFCFFDSKKTIEGSKQLKTYKTTDVGGGWMHAESDAFSDFQPGWNMRLDRLTLILSSGNKSTNISFGKIVMFSGNTAITPTDLKNDTEGCSGADHGPWAPFGKAAQESLRWDIDFSQAKKSPSHLLIANFQRDP